MFRTFRVNVFLIIFTNMLESLVMKLNNLSNYLLSMADFQSTRPQQLDDIRIT